ncbi:FUSC family protein [Actinoallomurus sp. NPDC050550]|uniref:FUSC family protein n=1 Tax=Actinoallomurus sp. NPDC050550 TaxID=3154937 RepID=UPI0033CC8CE7
MSDKAGDVPPKSPADGQAAPQHREAARHRSMAGLRRRLRFSDPGFVALRTALRAAIVLPIVFAVASRVIGDPQAALFASFGSFATLVFADFSGSPARRFAAYSTLAATGAVLIFVGTLCSRNPTLAAAAMAVVGFIILFAGVVNGYAAAGATAAILAFVLPVTIPAPLSAVPSRLEGWALAAGAGIAAQLLLWPARSRAILRTRAARACRALADLADAQVAGDAEAVVDRTRTAHEAVDELHRRFVGTPHRPTGLTGPTAALTSLIDELDFLLSFLGSPAGSPPISLCRAENAEAMRASAAALRASADRLDGQGSGRPDLGPLEEARAAMTRALARRLPELPAIPDHDALVALLEPTFRTRTVSYAAEHSARYALMAVGETVPEGLGAGSLRRVVDRQAHSVIRATELAIEDAHARSVWFRNSVRGAVGLAIAVYIAQRTGLQHSFWVVLGTLSVLRSNALGTGWSVLSALAGTAIGICVGAPLILAIGTHETVLWSVLPIAILIAAYAPRAISFAAGQAAFNVVLFVLFNLIQPSGWQVGLVRFEDVAIGFAISLGVGLLFWPRGAATLLRENLAAAYARSADYVLAATRRLVGHGDPAWSQQAEQDADAAVHRLDDSYRQFLSERSAQPMAAGSVAALVTGAARVRRVARSLAGLGRFTDGHEDLERCAENLDAEVHALRIWYIALGDCILHETAVPPPHLRDADGRRRLLEGVHAVVAGGDESALPAALALLWADQYVNTLWRLEGHLGRHATESSPAAVPAEASPVPA